MRASGYDGAGPINRARDVEYTAFVRGSAARSSHDENHSGNCVRYFFGHYFFPMGEERKGKGWAGGAAVYSADDIIKGTAKYAVPFRYI